MSVASKLAQGAQPRDIYAELEAELAPTITSLSRRFAPALDMELDDALQEARIAMLEACEGYQPEKDVHGIKFFVHRCVKNAFMNLLYKATSRTRLPEAVVERSVVDETGEVRRELVTVKMKPLSFDPQESGGPLERAASPIGHDEDAAMIARAVKRLSLRLVRSLDKRGRDVYRCKSTPSEEFLIFLRNSDVAPGCVNNLHIAEYLKISKNCVDWSLHKIKGEFVKIAEEPEFSGLVDELVQSGQWPMIHVSDLCNDADFVREIVNDRKLDPRPSLGRRQIQQATGVDGQVVASRIIESYQWGVVLHLRLGEDEATVVIEGRFNALVGEVFGEFGSWKNICDQLPWYKRLVRELKK